MAKKKTILEKNFENFINGNFDKKDRKRDDALKFEWFVNSMHIWQCSSQTFNADSKIGKKISLGTAQGGDAFFISVNDYEQIFSLNDNLEEVLNYIKNKGKTVTFHFIQTKKSQSADLGDFLKFMEIPYQIWKSEDYSPQGDYLKEMKNFIDSIVDDPALYKITHKIELSFYTTKNQEDITKLQHDWQAHLTAQENKFREYFNKENFKIALKGSLDLQDIYEKLNSNDYTLCISKSEVIEADEKKYLIGFITAKELLDCIAPQINGVRALYPDVFKNNIRLYLGRNTVNEKIEETLSKEPTKFHFYNNGLTITTKEIHNLNSKHYNIKPVNIVNGCQTANSVFNICRLGNIDEKSIKIPVKIIVAEDQEYENITIRTNTQNGIEAKDLVSITTIQKALETKFTELNFQNKKYYYKRQKSSENIDDEIDYIIQIDDILRASFATLLLIPHKVLGYFDVTTAEYIEKIFDDKFTQIFSIVTVLYKHIKTEIETTHTNYPRLDFHVLYLFYRYVCKDLRATDGKEQIKVIEEHFRQPNDLNEEDENNLEETVKSIYSKLYAVLQSEQWFKNIVAYIITQIDTHYPAFKDLSTKQKEKILYKPVQKTTKRSKVEVFGNFESIFSETISNLKTNENATN